MDTYGDIRESFGVKNAPNHLQPQQGWQIALGGGHANFFKVCKSPILKFLGSFAIANPQISQMCQSANRESANFQYYKANRKTGITTKTA